MSDPVFTDEMHAACLAVARSARPEPETAESLRDALVASEAARVVAEQRARVLEEALRSCAENDLTHYDHHQQRRDGKLPREGGGTCWRTPREIALAALSSLPAAPAEEPAK